MRFEPLLAAIAGAIIAVFSLTSSGACNLSSIKASWSSQQTCLTNSEAQQAADIYRLLIHDYSDELALEALTEDFVDWSSAVNIIRNKGGSEPFNLTAATFTSREAFMAGQGAQPPITFEMLGVWHGCDFISLRWMTTRSASGQATEVSALPVIGNSVLEVVPDAENQYGFRISALYAEFNSAAWLVNLGVFSPGLYVSQVQL